jgi:multiple sugar transport system permease protein
MITLIFVDAWIRIPFTALILLAGLKTIPQDIYESASIDGAGPIQKFTYITLPNLKYPISIVLILQTMFAFRTYDILAILTGGGPGRETELLVKYVLDSAFKDYQFGIASAVSIVMIVICILSSLIYWKSLKIEV